MRPAAAFFVLLLGCSDDPGGDETIECATTTRRSAEPSCAGVELSSCSDGHRCGLRCTVDGCTCSDGEIVVGDFAGAVGQSCETYWDTTAEIEAAFRACGADVTGPPAPPPG